MSNPRWKRRPHGSTWGDFGPDDELGRLNLITPEKVPPGRRRGARGADLLPVAAARLSRRQRPQPTPPPAGDPPDAARVAAELQLPPLRGGPRRHRRDLRRPGRHAPAILDPVGQPRPCRPALRRRRRRQAGGGLLQRLPGGRGRGRAVGRGRRRRAERARADLVAGAPSRRAPDGRARPAGQGGDDRPPRPSRTRARRGRLRRA